jgi:hypothetical protein
MSLTLPARLQGRRRADRGAGVGAGRIALLLELTAERRQHERIVAAHTHVAAQARREPSDVLAPDLMAAGSKPLARGVHEYHVAQHEMVCV